MAINDKAPSRRATASASGRAPPPVHVPTPSKVRRRVRARRVRQLLGTPAEPLQVDHASIFSSRRTPLVQLHPAASGESPPGPDALKRRRLHAKESAFKSSPATVFPPGIKRFG